MSRPKGPFHFNKNFSTTSSMLPSSDTWTGPPTSFGILSWRRSFRSVVVCGGLEAIKGVLVRGSLWWGVSSALWGAKVLSGISGMCPSTGVIHCSIWAILKTKGIFLIVVCWWRCEGPSFSCPPKKQIWVPTLGSQLASRSWLLNTKNLVYPLFFFFFQLKRVDKDAKRRKMDGKCQKSISRNWVHKHLKAGQNMLQSESNLIIKSNWEALNAIGFKPEASHLENQNTYKFYLKGCPFYRD